MVNPLFEKRPKNFGIGKFPYLNFAENAVVRCMWCKRIFAILRMMMTISHQDRWCISALRVENFSLKSQPQNQCLIFLRPGHSAQAWFDTLREMASLHPPAEAALHPLQTSESSPCNQPVHPGSGSSDRYVSSVKHLRTSATKYMNSIAAVQMMWIFANLTNMQTLPPRSLMHDHQHVVLFEH